MILGEYGYVYSLVRAPAEPTAAAHLGLLATSFSHYYFAKVGRKKNTFSEAPAAEPRQISPSTAAAASEAFLRKGTLRI